MWVWRVGKARNVPCQEGDIMWEVEVLECVWNKHNVDLHHLCGGDWPHVSAEHLKHGKFEFRCSVNIRYTPDVQDLVW